MLRVGALALTLLASRAVADPIVAAQYAEPTLRYNHAVLGDAEEWGALILSLADGRQLTIRLPEALVFEDVQPRLYDLDGDGGFEVIAVEASLTQGARLAIYDATGRIAATPFIGTRHRWLAPVGAGDFDKDGRVEIAYIDRPHLAKTLRIWRFEAGQLTEIAARRGLSNHKIGWDFIAGGVRDCGAGVPPEIIVASGDWQKVVSAVLADDTIQTRAIGPYTAPDSLDSAMECP